MIMQAWSQVKNLKLKAYPVIKKHFSPQRFGISELMHACKLIGGIFQINMLQFGSQLKLKQDPPTKTEPL